MSMSQSKLMLQLNKEQKLAEKGHFSQEKLQDLYTTISKLEPKNLMLVQFLTLMIEKCLVKSCHKIQEFADLYQEIKGKKLQQEHRSFNMMNNQNTNVTNYSNTSMVQNNFGFTTNSVGNMLQPIQKEQQKFCKKKFLKLLKDVAKLLYPGDPKAYEVSLYMKLTGTDQQENRMKVDDNIKKFLSEDILQTLSHYNKEFQTLFQVFMPENYNNKLGFSWNEIRLLEKKLPLICLLRILFEGQICPQLISTSQYLQFTSKMVPPLNTNHKEVMFYYSETFNSYMRQHIFNDDIKLLDGDIGLTFFEFQMILVRIATQSWKDAKQDVPNAIEKLMEHIGISDIIRNKRQINRMTKLQSSISKYLKENDKSSFQPTVTKSSLKKRTYFKKENQELRCLIDESMNERKLKTSFQTESEEPLKKLQHESMLITRDDLLRIKRNLDDQLAPIPQKVGIEKQNDGYFNVHQKFTVIGEQLPKLQEKNKPAPKPSPKEKKQDSFLGFKPQQEPKPQIMTKSALLLNRKKKLRINNQYPVILSEVFYPTSFSDQRIIQFKEDQEIYIETTYIHLGERMYEEAYGNFQKAQRFIKPKKIGSSNFEKRAAMMMEFYMQILEAQIFQAAGKDEAAFIHYHNAKEISVNFPTSQAGARAFSYMGMSSTLYHLEEYEFSLRCLLKAKQIYGDNIDPESVNNAILMNNIGCCYMMLNRNQEAVKFLNLSHQILDLKVGRFDERTLVVQQNISKNKKAFIDQMPSFKTMWKTYVAKGSALSTTKSVKKLVKK